MTLDLLPVDGVLASNSWRPAGRREPLQTYPHFIHPRVGTTPIPRDSPRGQEFTKVLVAWVIRKNRL
jgi:hypothetical protein